MPVQTLCLSAKSKSSNDVVPLPLLNIDMPRKYYVALELAVLLAQLGLLDAAYSGDWVVIGVISQGR